MLYNDLNLRKTKFKSSLLLNELHGCVKQGEACGVLTVIVKVTPTGFDFGSNL